MACFGEAPPIGCDPAARYFCWLQPLLRAGRIESPHPYPLAGDSGSVISLGDVAHGLLRGLAISEELPPNGRPWEAESSVFSRTLLYWSF